MYLEVNQTQTFSIGERLAEVIFPSVRERRNSLEREANVDKLTELANRAAFDKAQTAATADPDIFFIAFDCNNFGLVNKKFGHSRGDEILKAIASEIGRAATANRARAFRFGGDEFVVLVESHRAEYLRDAIERRVGEFDFGSFTVSISGEVAGSLEAADALLQARKTAKKKGK